jgi:hypothetical protein
MYLCYYKDYETLVIVGLYRTREAAERDVAKLVTWGERHETLDRPWEEPCPVAGLEEWDYMSWDPKRFRFEPIEVRA